LSILGLATLKGFFLSFEKFFKRFSLCNQITCSFKFSIFNFIWLLINVSKVLAYCFLIYREQKTRLSSSIKASSLILEWNLSSMLNMSTLNSSPQFNNENYAYWKVRMKAFLKSLDEKIWYLFGYWLVLAYCFSTYRVHKRDYQVVLE